MVERDEMQRALELARASLRAPAAAKARVRANLAAGGSAPPVKGAPGDATVGVLGLLTGSDATTLAGPAGRVATYARAWKAALWVGLGLCAGYWLGASQVSEQAGAGAVEAPAPVVRAPAESGARRPDEAPSTGGALVEAAPPVVATQPTRDRRVHLPASTPGKAGTAHAELARSEARRAATALHAPSSNPLGEEVLLLQRVERAIRAGDAELALSFLAELDRRFPVSPLREERAAARVLADCARASVSTDPNAWREPRAVAERFLASRAGSVYSDRIRGLCGLEGAGGTRGESSDRVPAVVGSEVSRAAGH